MWCTIIKVIVRIVEQLNNLWEYFLKFLPQQKNFKKEIKDNLRYKRIYECLKSKFTVPYLSFVVFIIIDFEKFLITFQSNTPIILLLHNKSVTLLKKLTTNFIDFNMLTFFFYVGNLWRAFTNHRTAGEGGGHFINFSLPLTSASQILYISRARLVIIHYFSILLWYNLFLAKGEQIYQNYKLVAQNQMLDPS